MRCFGDNPVSETRSSTGNDIVFYLCFFILFYSFRSLSLVAFYVPAGACGRRLAAFKVRFQKATRASAENRKRSRSDRRLSEFPSAA